MYYVKSEYYDTTGTLTLSTTLSVKNKRKYNFSLNRAFINQRIGIDFINSNPGYYKRKDYQYDTKGRLTVIRVQGYSSADGHSPLRRRIPFSYICRYDNAGRCIESDMDNDHGRSFFTYDENGNCIKRIDRPVFGEPTITTYVYGENCKVKEANRTGHNKGKSSYEYDNKDSLIFQKEESLGQIRSGMEGTSDNDTTFIRYKYDDNGSKIEEKKVSGDMSGSYEKSYQYIYDEHGNWTRKDEFISKQKPGYYLRKITYY